MGHSTRYYAINQLINVKYNSVGTRNKEPNLNDMFIYLQFESHNSHCFENLKFHTEKGTFCNSG